MRIMVSTFVVSGVAVVAVAAGACSRQQGEASGGGSASQAPVTNRLNVGPDVVANLGVTFEQATRGRLGEWRAIPGQLDVPEARRWLLRAPAAARVVTTASRWQRVDAGAVVATLASPELPEVQRALALAQANESRLHQELAAARARLQESAGHLEQTRQVEADTRRRVEQLAAPEERTNGLLVKEIIELRRMHAEANRATLEASILRDDLAAKVAAKEIERQQATMSFAAELQRMSLLTGAPPAELAAPVGDGQRWQQLDSLPVRAPAAGFVVDVHAAAGTALGAGDPVVELIDPSELRFRGSLPEGDLGTLRAGSPVRIAFASKQLAPVETTLAPLPPAADPVTRMVRVEAAVPNADGALVAGASALAHVLVREGANEEVLIPARCVVLDGLEAIVFKRDPENPNIVVRTPVELGARTADRVEVLAGVLAGDAVVADGVHQLKQTGLGKAPEGGHFHADGTWHSDHKK